MVRTRKKDYTELVRQRTAETKHIGKRNRGAVFSRFQELPCELRLMVWKAAMTPRLVVIKPWPYLKDHDEEVNPKTREIRLLRGIPALLEVNKEARHVALRHYTWRFTININRWAGDIDPRRARVVMSPDDTLGLFRFRMGRDGLMSTFNVKVANDKTSPWRIHETTDAPLQGFKKVAILGNAIRSNLHIVRALNITLWDLDSILHAESAGMRVAHSPHTKQAIFIKSGEATTVDWNVMGASVARASNLPLQDRDRQSPDIVAYELGDGEKRKEEWENFLRMLPQTRMGMWFL